MSDTTTTATAPDTNGTQQAPPKRRPAKKVFDETEFLRKHGENKVPFKTPGGRTLTVKQLPVSSDPDDLRDEAVAHGITVQLPPMHVEALKGKPTSKLTGEPAGEYLDAVLDPDNGL